MSDPIMEDVKHKFMWDTIIDIFKKVRNKKLIADRFGYIEYTIVHPEIGKTLILLIDDHGNIDNLKKLICSIIFNDLNVANCCYLCEYRFQYKHQYISCKFCPVKIMTSDIESCLNGLYIEVNRHLLCDVLEFSNSQFQEFIHYCEEIRDVEYKEGVILRSQLNEQSVQFKPFDKVLVRNFDHKKWCATFFSHYEYVGNHVKYWYCCIDGVCYTQCIPYEGNEYLVGTTYVPK